ncbi:MAG: hypothetical protein ABL914_01735 [Novosphingobium sp.]|uniref:hypothetical protein n=1 Tax=Novosphingobium sp. TaxID=1874826 RepID=UPI0032BC8FAB
MKFLSHPIAGLSIGLALSISVMASAVPPAPKLSPYFGRWTISDANERFSAKGRPYKTIDIAPCGKDFCGVSVGDKGQCGPVLFRFLTKNAFASMLQGHGKWGSGKKNIQIENWENPEAPGGREMELYLGDGHDFGGRSESMPKFHGQYNRAGAVRCKAR